MSFAPGAGQYGDRSQEREETKMGTMTFVNLSVKDLEKATEFFSEVGFACDPQFTTRPPRG